MVNNATENLLHVIIYIFPYEDMQTESQLWLLTMHANKQENTEHYDAADLYVKTI